ncbi:reverse transcriptase domain-containing protein [Tanacetum coccineum]
MGTTLTTNDKQLLADILRENIEVFAWTESERTAVPRFVMEHQLKIYPISEPVVHKRRPMTPEGRQALKEKVSHWLKEGLIRKVPCPEWIANAISIQLANGTWKVQLDYSSLNKVYAKDIQIRMAEDDEEKIGFHTEEGVYYFTHMLKELKNSDATLHRMMEKVLANQKKLGKLQTLAVPKEGEDLLLCLRQRNKTISSVLLIEREGIQIPVSYVSRPLQGMEICYTLTKKMVQALIHTTRSSRAIIRKHKVKVVTDGPMEEILKLFGREGRLGKWATKIRTYDISHVQRKEAEESVEKKQLKKVQAEELSWSAPKKRCIRMTSEFKASNHAMDCEALLVGLAASAYQGYEGLTCLHLIINNWCSSKRKPYTGNGTRKKVQRGNYECNGPIPQLEFLNQEVSVGIKTRPSIEETSSSKKGKVTSKALEAKPNYNHKASGSN